LVVIIVVVFLLIIVYMNNGSVYVNVCVNILFFSSIKVYMPAFNLLA